MHLHNYLVNNYSKVESPNEIEIDGNKFADIEANEKNIYIAIYSEKEGIHLFDKTRLINALNNLDLDDPIISLKDYNVRKFTFDIAEMQIKPAPDELFKSSRKKGENNNEEEEEPILPKRRIIPNNQIEVKPEPIIEPSPIQNLRGGRGRGRGRNIPPKDNTDKKPPVDIDDQKKPEKSNEELFIENANNRNSKTFYTIRFVKYIPKKYYKKP